MKCCIKSTFFPCSPSYIVFFLFFSRVFDLLVLHILFLLIIYPTTLNNILHILHNPSQTSHNLFNQINANPLIMNQNQTISN